MNKMLKRLFTLAGVVAISLTLSLHNLYAITVINSPLNKALIKIFPEIKDGYIDLNNNGKPDQTDELNEYIPESVIKDNQLQGKEILDFIINYYMFLPLDKVRKVKEILDHPQGVISEIVALQYRIKIYEIEKRREEMQKSGKRVTTSSEQQKTEERLRELITIMINSYKKEGKNNEQQLINARKEFLKIINEGFSVPQDITRENKNILTSIMINRILKTQKSDKEDQEVITAINVVGQLKQDFAVSYLMDFLSDLKYKKYVIRALGEIGNSIATKRLLRELQKDQPIEIKLEIIRALGNIGNKTVVEKLKTMLSSKEEMQNIQIKKEVLFALSNASEKYQDPTLVPVFTKYLKSDDSYFRMIAIRGLANLNAFNAVNELNSLLKTETDPPIQIELIRAIHKLKAPNYINTFGFLLKKKNLDPEVRKTILKIFADEPRTELVMQKLIEHIGFPDESIQETAKQAILKQSKRNPKAVATAVSNILMRSKDKSVLVNGSEILSQIKDPVAIPTFLYLLKSDYKKVRENATWGIYKLGKIDNITIVAELLQIATNESQPISVRTNAIRALGEIGYTSSRYDVVGSLINIIKLQDEKYTMMRYFAIRSLGKIKVTNKKVYSLLSRLLLTEQNKQLKREIIHTLNRLGDNSPVVVRSLKKAFKREENKDLQIDILMALGDIGSDDTLPLAKEFLEEENNPTDEKIEAIYILSKIGTRDCISPILNCIKDKNLKAYAYTTLLDFDPDIILPYLKERLRTETDKVILDTINTIVFRFEED